MESHTNGNRNVIQVITDLIDSTLENHDYTVMRGVIVAEVLDGNGDYSLAFFVDETMRRWDVLGLLHGVAHEFE